MKVNKLYIAAAAAMSLSFAACNDEKDLVVIEGNLPIKTSSLYMVGDATPNGWNIDAPTPLAQSADDPLIFSWEGELNTGEMKLCLTPGSWDAPFVRPVENGTEIGKEPIVNAPFQMHAGDPDEKWRIAVAGKYLLTFDMRNWCMSSSFLGGTEGPKIEPIETECLFIVGDATPNGWNIDEPTQLTKTADYTFVFEGPLNTGEMKAGTVLGSWDAKFVRPSEADVEINKSGVAADNFVYTTGPDNKWKVTYAANYRLTFNLKDWKIKVEYVSDLEGGETPEVKPIEAEHVYMLGDATPGGWSQDDAAEFTKLSQYVFEWKGTLVSGNMKACIEKDPSWGQNFLRPAVNGTEISRNGVADNKVVFTKDPDDQWKVTEAGEYTITFDLEKYTITVKAVGAEDPSQPDDPNALKSETLYMIGDATPGGWSMDSPSQFTRSADNIYIFTWEGQLNEGDMKACLQPDGTFSCPFLRPAKSGVTISENGVSEPSFVYTTDPDDKWRVTKAGKYRITFDLAAWTIKAELLN